MVQCEFNLVAEAFIVHGGYLKIETMIINKHFEKVID